MKKVLLLSIILNFASNCIFAQQQVNNMEARPDTLQIVSTFKHHSIYVELLGSSTFYSVNYDYLFRIYKDNIKLAVGAGIGYLTMTTPYKGVPEKRKYTVFYFTPEINFLFGKKSHYLETGTALLFGIYDKQNVFFPSGRVGYRYQPQKGGFLFRVAYTPLLMEDSWIGFNYLLFGISFGYIF